MESCSGCGAAAIIEATYKDGYKSYWCPDCTDTPDVDAFVAANGNYRPDEMAMYGKLGRCIATWRLSEAKLRAQLVPQQASEQPKPHVCLQCGKWTTEGVIFCDGCWAKRHPDWTPPDQAAQPNSESSDQQLRDDCQTVVRERYNADGDLIEPLHTFCTKHDRYFDECGIAAMKEREQLRVEQAAHAMIIERIAVALGVPSTEIIPAAESFSQLREVARELLRLEDWRVELDKREQALCNFGGDEEAQLRADLRQYRREKLLAYERLRALTERGK